LLLPFSHEAYARIAGEGQTPNSTHSTNPTTIQPPPVINLKEFILLVRQGEETRQAVFNSIDSDHDGELAASELQQAFKPEFASHEELDAFVNECMAVADLDSNGTISYGEFARWSVLAQANSVRALL
jgi:Ca2+-binding EF-hand superfamily protein